MYTSCSPQIIFSYHKTQDIQIPAGNPSRQSQPSQPRISKTIRQSQLSQPRISKTIRQSQLSQNPDIQKPATILPNPCHHEYQMNDKRNYPCDHTLHERNTCCRSRTSKLTLHCRHSRNARRVEQRKCKKYKR